MPLFSIKCFACDNQFDYDTDKNATMVRFWKEEGAPQIYLISCPACGETNEVEYREG
jgi:uncharacterized protein CbrC (UPF0167 family)